MEDKKEVKEPEAKGLILYNIVNEYLHNQQVVFPSGLVAHKTDEVMLKEDAVVFAEARVKEATDKLRDFVNQHSYIMRSYINEERRRVVEVEALLRFLEEAKPNEK